MSDVKNIAVIGGGYVGLVTAACLAEAGHKINLIEIDHERVRALEAGIMPINEPGLPELWQRNRAEGRLQVTSHYIEGLLGVEFAFIAVGTPSAASGKPNLKWVRMAAKNIAEAASRSLTIVIKSTVPVGTAEEITKIIADRNHNGFRFATVSNPEFLREGSAVFDFMNPTRIVVGSSDGEANQAVVKLFERLNSPIVMCDNRTAELSKYASNVFLATRISFMNEMALLCDEYGVDVVKVSEIMGLDPRFGKGYLNAGLGWGGSCLPKDVRGLIHMAKNRKIPARLLNAVQKINQQQPLVVVRKLNRFLGDLQGKTIGVLGLSFKPDSYDVREARSLAVISLLEKQGCFVKAYDPVAMKATAKILPEITYCSDAYEAAKDSEALLLVTEWDEFKKLDMKRLASLMKFPFIVDTRNLYDPEELVRAGFVYEGIGRPRVKSTTAEAILVD